MGVEISEVKGGEDVAGSRQKDVGWEGLQKGVLRERNISPFPPNQPVPERNSPFQFSMFYRKVSEFFDSFFYSLKFYEIWTFKTLLLP